MGTGYTEVDLRVGAPIYRVLSAIMFFPGKRGI